MNDRVKKLFTDQTDLERLRELIKTYAQGFQLEDDLAGQSASWLRGFYHAFDRVDEIIGEFIEEVID